MVAHGVSGMVRLLSLGVVLVSIWLVYLSRENYNLRQQLTSALASLDVSSTSCVLPPVTSSTATGANLTLTFPRDRPALILSIRRGCDYCNSALNTWPALLRITPGIDGIIYEGTGPYSRLELEASGIAPEVVMKTPLTTSPYSELLRATPTVMLVGKSGCVLGKWTGELSRQQVARISAAIRTLLM